MSSNRPFPECFAPRLEMADRHVDRGEWASGHAIASRLLTCARQSCCPVRHDCACAAEKVMGDIRRLIAA